MKRNCPHQNTHCSTERPCGPCSGSFLRDGERVVVPVVLMDSKRAPNFDSAIQGRQREIASQLKSLKDSSNRIQAYADGYRKQYEDRDRAARANDNGWHAMRDRLSRAWMQPEG